MKPRTVVILLALLFASALIGAYQYYFSSYLWWQDLANWYEDGSVVYTYYGITTNSGDGGSLISKVAVPDGTSDYEVMTALWFNSGTPGGNYAHYLRASTDAMAAPATRILCAGW